MLNLGLHRLCCYSEFFSMVYGSMAFRAIVSYFICSICAICKFFAYMFRLVTTFSFLFSFSFYTISPNNQKKLKKFGGFRKNHYFRWRKRNKK